MRQSKTVGFLILMLGFAVAMGVLAVPTRGEAAKTKQGIEAEKKEIRQKSSEILAQLYKVQPSAKTAVSKAAGYATFSNYGMKIFVSSAAGRGRASPLDNKTKKQVFMDMFELQTGLGMGVKKFILVWIFETPKAHSQFINSGWELGAPDECGCQERRQGRLHPGRPAYRTRRVALSAHRGRPGAGAHGEGHEILQGRRLEQVSRSRARGGRTGLADAGAANPVRLPTCQPLGGGGASPTDERQAARAELVRVADAARAVEEASTR